MDEVPDASVALVVTSPPYFAGKEYEEALGHGEIPATYLQYLDMLGAVFAECVKKLEPGGRIAINVANLGRRPYRSLSSDVVGILERDLQAPAARRSDLAEGAGLGGLVRVGLVPEGDEPGVARPHRTRRHREQGSLRPRAVDGATQGTEPPVPVVARTRAVHGRHHRRVGDGAGERAACQPSRAVPGRAADAADRPVHLQGRPRPRPVHGFGHDRGRGGPRRASLRRLRPRPRVRARRSRARRRRNASAPPRRCGATSRSACCRPSRTPTTPRTCSSRPARCTRAKRPRKSRRTC